MVQKQNAQPRKRAIKTLFWFLTSLSQKTGGAGRYISPYVISTIASPPLGINNQNQSQDQNNGDMSYVPHSPYYAPVHPPEFYKDA